MTDKKLYREIVDAAKLRYLIENAHEFHLGKSYINGKLVDGEAQLTIMKNYLEAIELGGGELAMEYHQHDGMGRRWSKRPGLANMSRIVRHTITRGILRDIDAKSAHPTLLEHYCKTHNIPCVFLSEYIENYELWLQRICADRGWARDEAKKFMLAPINKESNSIDYLAWDNKKLRSDIHSYMMEMNQINRRVCDMNPDLVKLASKKKEYNIGGSTVNRLLCDLENKMLTCITEVVVECGGEVNALVYDGCMVSHISDMDELCARAERRIKERMGVSMRIVEKIMDEGVDLSQCQLPRPRFRVKAEEVSPSQEEIVEASERTKTKKKEKCELKSEMSDELSQAKDDKKKAKEERKSQAEALKDELREAKRLKREEKERQAEAEHQAKKELREKKRVEKEQEQLIEKQRREEEKKQREEERLAERERKQDERETQKHLGELLKERQKKEEDEMYAKWKIEWEAKRHGKILDEDSYIYWEGADSLTPSTRSAFSLISTYGHTTWSKFLVRWIKDPSIVLYKKMDMYSHDKECPKNIFNLWKDFPFYKKETKWVDVSVERMIEDQVGVFIHTADSALQFVLNHLKVLVNHQEESYNYFQDLIGCWLQYPSVKTPLMSFVSQEGAGKGTYADILRLLFGRDKVVSVSDADMLFGKFNGVLQNAFITIMNELDARELSRYDGRLKDYITDPTIVIQKKGHEPKEMNSNHHFIHFTNEENCPIQTSQSDRRKFIVRCSNELIGNTDYFKELRMLIEHQPMGQILHDYFMKRDVEQFKIECGSKIPITEFQAELREVRVDAVKEWIRHLAFSEEVKELYIDGFLTYNYVQCCSSFKMYCEAHQYRFMLDSSALGSRIFLLKLKGIEKKRTNICRLVVFNRTILQEELSEV